MLILRTLVLSFCLLFISNSFSKDGNESLYDALGGQQKIELITTNLLKILYEDERIAFHFEEADKIDLHEKIVDQICMETGGGCKYEGLDMVESHSGFELKYSEFDAFVEDFILALEQSEVPFKLQNKVLAIFAPMRDDITYK